MAASSVTSFMRFLLSRSITRSCYSHTRGNFNVNKDTKVICQGFTGKQVYIDLKYFKCSGEVIYVRYILCNVAKMTKQKFQRKYAIFCALPTSFI
ncbi:hypothetical protein TNIN_31981 [Trichonephila inaurata madagascariensis]|uniref:Uncharacterized protein n=1 Tax=Trichonephila inaurata madagascariensis TaxID=2747483 RepID=A0A8X7BPX3_9ARAC|nr:hypothetical protein TNIN_31981 [Trichonephila inaurata madagascariensis]